MTRRARRPASARPAGNGGPTDGRLHEGPGARRAAPRPETPARGGLVLITGGAGFIGARLSAELLDHGYRVRVLDCLHPQVHGPGGGWPAYLPADVERARGRVEDAAALARALDGVRYVVHLAARVGVGQSMYEIADYTRANNLGTARLLEALLNREVDRLVVASSMSVYGEGAYRTADGAQAEAEPRSRAQLRAGRWDPLGPDDRPLVPVPTTESKRPELASVYALSKFDQERLCLLLGEAYGIPTVALRLFNVFGPHQALSNPYTGVLAIFASRLLNGNAPLVYEDGRQRRDFVHVSDVARAFRLALESPRAPGHVLNIGSGVARTIESVAERLVALLGPAKEPVITGRYRVGDVRHCFADIGRARRRLGYEPRVGFDEGVAELAGWLQGQEATDRVGEANEELAARGLVV